MSLPVVVIGLSHKTAPVDVREKFAAGSELLPEVLARLTSRPELEEVMFLSTCNRVEVIALPKAGSKKGEAALAEASRAIREALREHVGASSSDELADYLYERDGDEAVRHLFRVAASLDSMVLGEPQILGQVKDAYDAAVAAGSLKNHLARCLNRAFTVAKRVRSETQLGAGMVSISSVAVDLARRIFGDLSDCTVLLVGAGEMAEQAAKSLVKGAKAIRVCNRSVERAANLAATFGGSAAPLDMLEAELVVSDVVVASTSAKHYVITKDLVKRVMKARKGRTLFFVDIAVPRNVDPEVHQLDNVYVFNVDDLEQEVAENLKLRQKEVAAAEAIVDKELQDFATWARSLDVAPTIVGLRTKTKAVLVAELERTLGSRLKHLGEEDRAALLQMIESATNKLLHAPTARLREASSGNDAGDLVQAVQHLFDLPKGDEAPSPEVHPGGNGSKPEKAAKPVAAARPPAASAESGETKSPH